MRLILGSILAIALAPAGPATAQNRSQDTIVVTGSMVTRDYDIDRPAVTLRRKADKVLFEVQIDTGTRDPGERFTEVKTMLERIAERDGRVNGIEVAAGSAGTQADLSTTTPEELIRQDLRADRASAWIVVKVDVLPDDTFPRVRGRAEAFLEGLSRAGRIEFIMGDEQYLTVSDPAQYRAELLRAIASDLAAIGDAFGLGDTEFEIEGLQRGLVTRPAGPLEVELYIPYEVVTVVDGAGDD